MADRIELNVDVRPRTGKGGAREARRNGLVPGVLYGGGQDPVAITLKKNELQKAHQYRPVPVFHGGPGPRRQETAGDPASGADAPGL